MYILNMYILINIIEDSILPETIIQTESKSVVQKYLHNYCLNKIFELQKNEKPDNVNFLDYVIEDPKQLENYDDGYYLKCINDYTIDIYQKITIPKSWFSWESFKTNKIMSIIYAKCDKQISLPDENKMNKVLFNELSSKLHERRSKIKML